MAEAVIDTVFALCVRVAHGQQARVDQVLLQVALGGEMLEGHIPAARGIAQAKGLDGGIGQLALLAQVGQHVLVLEEVGAVEDQRVLEQFTQVLVRFLDLRRLALEFLDLHARALGQFLQRLAEVDALALHHELEDVAALVALTEAAPRARLGPDHEGGRMFVVVEGAESRIVAPRLAQLHPRLGDEVNDIDFGFDLVGGGHAGAL